ncbi:MAG: chemotaxis protein CheW [Spirochaetia bacterium]|nr:chemotaxis protein CheW [Spirochaetia bacterium]MDD7612033.1 chemotaxis protein CheW [Spirochaetales bacterium]MDY5915855.1 chemotaxis protein CheW [Treponema sp.]
MATEVQFQLVTFRLGEELYGVNIMDVKEIVRLQNVRVIPNAPYYVEGIIKLRSEIIPIIDLHKRFNIQSTSKPEDIEMEGGFIILDIEGSKIGIIIDKVERVVTIKEEEVKEPPQMLSGIGNEYIEGVVREEHGYLIMLNTRKLFNASELQKIIDIQ